MDVFSTKKTDLVAPIQIIRRDGYTSLIQLCSTDRDEDTDVILIDDVVLSEIIAILSKIKQELENERF